MIDQVLTLIQYGAYGFGFFGLICFFLLAASYWRNQRREEERLKQAKAEIADMTLLFKTMRDIIKQQKSIAREFNEEIDAKMTAVKTLLEQGVQRNERLYERQQELTTLVREAKDELASIQRQSRFLREDHTETAARLRDSVAAERAPGPVVKPKPPEPAPAEDRLTGTGVTQASFTDWMGPDFDSLATAAPAEEPPPAPKVDPPEAPEDAEAAREAFRALLDLDTAPPQPVAPAPPKREAPGPNGSAARLQTRVREYSDAGMTVPEIARELGIGKGEVRLALSLARRNRDE